jgi:hypothetical protein
MAAFFEVCRDLGPGTGVIVEHLELEDVDPAVRFAIERGAAYGISFARQAARP